MAFHGGTPAGVPSAGAAVAGRAGRSFSEVGRLLARLRPRGPDRDQRYRTLFECVSDGFAVVEVIRDGAGEVIDYVVLEANPALLKMLGWDASPVGKRQSELVRGAPPAWLKACGRAVDGGPLSFEYSAPRSQRWFEVRLSPMGRNCLAQLVVEITDRKLAERRHRDTMDELNHRVKNNLAVVSAMLEMQARAADLPQVSEHLRRAVDRIQTIADVHASLYRAGADDEVEFASYLQDLCARLRKSVLDADRIELTLEAEPARLPLDVAMALGVVINELITNAAKHAFPPPARGKVSVTLARTAKGLELTVGDSGPGLPMEPAKSGLGMRLVRSLVQQTGAELQVDRSPGATFHVRLPKSVNGHRPAPPAQTKLL